MSEPRAIGSVIHYWTGLGVAGVELHVGELYLADIGVPPALYAEEQVGIVVGDLFAQGDVIRLR